ncbi:substrate-binding domain-containing protein [Blastopirellula marina]|uniref:LysR substrate-binding domain-containing protein n=1 Tax=Blastopirellula marina TaxID=124 RepID=A0A2S8GSF2_9BACT|nr:substrate-binding domain-containing protein [Blastopirellula marina]PQO47358.1 hypothetical protein C5Y93_04770 [Blastopirellula marina]
MKSGIDHLEFFCGWYKHLLDGVPRSDIAEMLYAAKPISEADTKRTKNSVEVAILRNIDDMLHFYDVSILEAEEATDEGKEFFDRAEDALRAFRSLKLPTLSTVVKIATIDAGACYWIPRALAENDFLKQHPNINLEIRIREWWQVIADVRSGRAHFGVATDIPNSSVETKTFLSRPHQIVMHENHRLAEKEVITADSLRTETIVCLSTSALPADFAGTFPESQTVVLQTGSEIVNWLANGIGVGFLPHDMIPLWTPLVTRKYKGVPLPVAKDALITRKQTKKNKRKLPEHAQQVYDCILNFWAAEKAPQP